MDRSGALEKVHLVGVGRSYSRSIGRERGNLCKEGILRMSIAADDVLTLAADAIDALVRSKEVSQRAR